MYATQLYAEWALDNDCKLSSPILFCRLSLMIQFPEAAMLADDAKTSTV